MIILLLFFIAVISVIIFMYQTRKMKWSMLIMAMSIIAILFVLPGTCIVGMSAGNIPSTDLSEWSARNNVAIIWSLVVFIIVITLTIILSIMRSRKVGK